MSGHRGGAGGDGAEMPLLKFLLIGDSGTFGGDVVTSAACLACPRRRDGRAGKHGWSTMPWCTLLEC